VRVYAQLKRPLSLKKFGNVWVICIKGTPYNVLHNDAGIFVVFNNEADARAAYEEVKWVRKNVKYLKNIVIE